MTGNQNWRTPPELLHATGVTTWGLDAVAAMADRIFPDRDTDWLGPGSDYAEDTLATSLADIEATAWVARYQWRDNPVWLNPPYADPLPWVEWCIANRDHTPAIYLLLLCDPSTKWWRRAIEVAHEARMLGSDGVQGGRVPFIDSETGKPASGNTKPSVLFVFHPSAVPSPGCRIWTWDWRSAAKTRCGE